MTLNREVLAGVLSKAAGYARHAESCQIGQSQFLRTGRMDEIVLQDRADAFDRESIRAWVERCGFASGTAANQLARGALYSDISWHVRQKIPVSPPEGEMPPWDRIHLRFWTGIRAQHILQEGLRRAKPAERQQFADAVLGLRVEHSHVTDHFIGALASARVEEALRQTCLDVGVRSATLFEDAAQGADLIVTSRWPDRGGCVVQVKATGPGQTRVHLTDIARRPHIPELPHAGKTWAGVVDVWEAAYLRRLEQGRKWHGLVAHVDAWSLPAAELLDPYLCNLLRTCLLETDLCGGPRSAAENTTLKTA